MNKKTLILSLILLMAGICFGGATPTLDILLQGGFGTPIVVVNGDFSDTSSGNSFTAPLAGWANHGTHTSNKHFLINGGLSAVSDINSASIAEEFGIFKSGILIIGRSYTMTVDVSVVASGTYSIGSTQGGNDIVAASTSTGVQTYTFTAVGVDLCISNGSAGGNIFTFDDVTLVDNSVDAWVAGAGWLVNDSASGVAAFISTGSDSTLAQPTIALVDGATYKVTFTVSGIDLQDPIAYYGIQLDGNTNANTFTQNGTYVYYIVAGGSTGSGLEISSVNTTTGDTLTIDNVSVIVEHFKNSTNEDSVIVLGDIKVPAGPDVIEDGSFIDWTLPGIPNDSLADWNLAETPSGTNYITEISLGSGLKMEADGTGLTLSQDTLIQGKEYLLTLSGVSVVGPGFDLETGGKLIDSNITTGLTYQFVAQGTDITIFSASATVDIESIVAYELTDGPIDEYPWDEFGDYGEDPGMFNGSRVYKSANTHADGVGGLAIYYIWQRDNDWWHINQTVNSPNAAPRWQRDTLLIGDYGAKMTPAPLSLGTATVTYGPVNHSEESGSAGFETSGVSQEFIDLKTDWDYLNNITGDQFGIVSVFNVSSTSSGFRRIYSAEDGLNAFLMQTFSTPESLAMLAEGSPAFNSNEQAVASDTLHHVLTSINIDDTDGWFYVDGVLASTDTGVDALVSYDNTILRLGARADNGTTATKTCFGFHAILYFDAVTLVNVAWSTGLDEAIQAAAVANDYDPHDIAAAIAAYDNNITGHYYALNELASGDASDYYLLAYDVQTQTAITQGFYGLTSPSGVTGTVLVPAPSTGGGYRGRYQGLYRARYNGVGRY